MSSSNALTVLDVDQAKWLCAEAQKVARNLAACLRGTASDRDEYAADLSAYVVAKHIGFDPERGSWEAFAAMLLRQRRRELIKEHLRRQRREFISLDNQGTDTTADALRQSLSESHALVRAFGEPFDHELHFLRRRLLNRLLPALSTDERNLCRHFLEGWSIPQIVEARLCSRATLYRRLRRMRATAITLGLENPS